MRVGLGSRKVGIGSSLRGSKEGRLGCGKEGSLGGRLRWEGVVLAEVIPIFETGEAGEGVEGVDGWKVGVGDFAEEAFEG